MDNGKYKVAISTLKSAACIDTTNTDVYRMLEESYAQVGDNAKAAEARRLFEKLEEEQAAAEDRANREEDENEDPEEEL